MWRTLLTFKGDLVPIESRGVYQSYINIVFGLGSALGAALGGAIADSLGWRWEFGIQVPYIAICTLAAAIVVPRSLGLETTGKRESFLTAMKAFDYRGSLLLTTSITFLILGLVSVVPNATTATDFIRTSAVTHCHGHTGSSLCRSVLSPLVSRFSYGSRQRQRDR